MQCVGQQEQGEGSPRGKGSVTVAARLEVQFGLKLLSGGYARFFDGKGAGVGPYLPEFGVRIPTSTAGPRRK
jgi:hypothetical protein